MLQSSFVSAWNRPLIADRILVISRTGALKSPTPLTNNKKGSLWEPFLLLVEKVGFEPTIRY